MLSIEDSGDEKNAESFLDVNQSVQECATMRHKKYKLHLSIWTIPTLYSTVALAAGLTFPKFESRIFPGLVPGRRGRNRGSNGRGGQAGHGEEVDSTSSQVAFREL